ncbi:lecithin retinol acyltransferase family protein [Streptomyces sp. NPDC007905]|uniref:lecithin retinol acyltransferase family protein n=1 Tax=Streptomyces sp. NPDC007905 TaxID=3364788 RepID=UPI0036E46EB7
MSDHPRIGLRAGRSGTVAAGDHLVVARPDGWVAAGRRHHGIDLGDGTVAHLTGFSKRSAKALRTNIRVFAQSGDPQASAFRLGGISRADRGGPWFVAACRQAGMAGARRSDRVLQFLGS